MIEETYYEYSIDLQNYEIRKDDPDIKPYGYRYRDSFITCLQKCKHRRMETERKVPTNRVRGYMSLTARGRIKDYGVYGKDLDMRETSDILIRLFYTCLNDAAMRMDKVTLKVPVKLYTLNKKLEDVWMTIGCEITATVTHRWVPKKVKILNNSYDTWERKKKEQES